uniref:Gibberellin regulated protein n=3 Tax=Triticinae TaxID=1648030 RepID=A0A452Z6S8_AEGTS
GKGFFHISTEQREANRQRAKQTGGSWPLAMAGKARVFMCVALVVLLLLVETTAPSGQAHAVDCGSACSYRCSKSSRPNLCNRACNTCCRRCDCVPPGTAGNEDVCPCYAHMTTHDGRHKCP